MSSDLDMAQDPQRGTPWGHWATLGWSIVVLGSMIGAGGAMVWVIQVQELWPRTAPATLATSVATDGNLLSLCTLFAHAIGVAFIFRCVQLRRGISFSDYLDIHPVSLKTILCWNGLWLIFLGFCESLSRAIKHHEPYMEQLLSATTQPALLFLAVVVTAPIFEELLFRGFMLPGLQGSRLGSVGSIVFTSGLWAMLHSQYDWFSIGIIFLMGWMLGYAHIQTRSIYVPISMHVLNNLLVFVLTDLNLS